MGKEINIEEKIKDNMKLVYKIVNQYFGEWKYKQTGLFDYEDLIQIGTIALAKGIEGFNESLGYKFSTYASSRIRGDVSQFLRDTYYRARIKQKKITKVVSVEDEIIKGLKFEELLPLKGFENDTVDNIMLGNFLKTLDAKERKIIAYKMTDISQSEIAKKIGLSQVSVSNKLKRIRIKYENFCDC